MRIALVTDAWMPQINGVVRTLSRVVDEVGDLGHEVHVVAPDKFRTVPCPTYPEIRLSLWPFKGVREQLDAFQPEAIHIATEGPLGFAARGYCRRRKLPFTTSFHTRFPEYVSARTKLPVSWGYAAQRWFHAPAEHIMVTTPTLKQEMIDRRFPTPVLWSRGVDTAVFRPRNVDPLSHLPRPIFTYVGRVAVEKNIEAFLGLDLPGSKVVIGDGPQRPALETRYPEVNFLGAKVGEELAQHYAASDVFVFPSKTDTFGLVLLEALASGVPVAAFPVPGPNDVVNGHDVGVLDPDLRRAAEAALEIPGERCRDYALRFSWTNCARQFIENLVPFRERNEAR
jgi:glycosyltransferase involved in cell wall biosynthesis